VFEIPAWCFWLMFVFACLGAVASVVVVTTWLMDFYG
jgi:hypothetical protein